MTIWKRAAILVTLSYSVSFVGAGETITFHFTGSTIPEYDDPGPGIFSVSNVSSPVWGSFTMNTNSFVPDSVFNVPTSSEYRGGTNSTIITVSDVSGTDTLRAAWSDLTITPFADPMWDLESYDPVTKNIIEFTFRAPDMTVNPERSLLFSPLNYRSQSTDSFLAWVLPDADYAYLEFTWGTLSQVTTPEPATWGLGLIGFSFLVLRSRSTLSLGRKGGLDPRPIPDNSGW